MGFSDVPNYDAGIEFVIDGGGAAITTGDKGGVEIPFDGEIEVATLDADQSGSIVVDVWVGAYSALPLTSANSITASAKPTLSSAQKSQDATLTGWTTAVSKGDWAEFNVDSVATVQRVTVSLRIRKTT